ncbi:MAG TPA: SUMF1/EgtB/PvdO family nonheme iron enzyme [Methylomirabilota bacterium]|jgi:formylglycine-generating enzyme required for sulfatase activity|nr:SUMF1/EgtB/PvdO family nonheme iron enzyme [Methylomirabilota bacterium]
MDTVVVPAGEFWMGGDDGGQNERPRHRVSVDSFELGRYEVTNAEFRAFLDGNGYAHRELWSIDGWRWRTRENVTSPQFWTNGSFNQPTQPVVGVSWYEAEAFCRFAGLRLPTEAEWERAARGTDERIYPWGDHWDARYANGGGGASSLMPVGSFPAGMSPDGAYDLAGNVWEWVSDWYEPDYYAHSPTGNPSGPASGRDKVWRGGAYVSSSPLDLRGARREFMTIDVPKFLRPKFVGFRCARTPRATKPVMRERRRALP